MSLVQPGGGDMLCAELKLSEDRLRLRTLQVVCSRP